MQWHGNDMRLIRPALWPHIRKPRSAVLRIALSRIVAISVLAAMLLVATPGGAQDAAMTPVIQEPMDAGTATPILGRRVLDQSGKAAGRIVDVLVDEGGQARAAVIDVGGFMGLGNRRIAVGWRALRFNPVDATITILMPADQIGAAPEYKPAIAPVVIASPPP